MTESATADAPAFTFPVELPSGTVEVDAIWDRASDPWAILVLAHGAGAGMTHPFLAGFGRAAADEGLSTLRFTFPYLQAGRRMPGPAPHAISAWRAAMDAAAAGTTDVALPVIAAGKSYGGRMASMAAAEGAIAPAALLYLGYPLHPPGKPEKPRVEHLPLVESPQLFVSGTRDAFVDPHDQLEAAVGSCRDATLMWVEGGHSFEVAGRKRDSGTIGAELAPVVIAELRRILSR